jgi:antitoxin (DNA-binding transcriptional repressor) of toxin-antitoxin stability system
MNTTEANLNPSIDLVEFKAHCLEVLEQLVPPGLIVTKEGRPLARITPVATVNNEPLIGSMNGEIEIKGEVFSTQIADERKDAAAFQWINAHASDYHGQWLALDGDRLLAHSANLAEVAAAARALGVQFPLLHLVEPPRDHHYIHA